MLFNWRHDVTQCPRIDTQYEEGNINIKSDRLINNTGDDRERRCYFCFGFHVVRVCQLLKQTQNSERMSSAFQHNGAKNIDITNCGCFHCNGPHKVAQCTR